MYPIITVKICFTTDLVFYDNSIIIFKSTEIELENPDSRVYWKAEQTYKFEIRFNNFKFIFVFV